MGPDVKPAARGAAAGTTFRYSFLVLPAHGRDAIKTVYRFCRITDDIVDNESDTDRSREHLQRWRASLKRALAGHAPDRAAGMPGRLADALPDALIDLAEVAERYHINPAHFFDLVDGVEMDLFKDRYATYAELEKYCRLVASSVGMMCLAPRLLG